LCLAASVLLVVLGVVACAGAPQLCVTELRYNFGLVIEGSDVVHTFVFRNVGDQPHTALDVVTGCGCTATEISRTTIERGPAGEFTATFRSDGYENETVLKYISMQTDDPNLPTVRFELAGTVMSRGAVLLDPSEVSGRLLLVFGLRSWDSHVAGHLLGALHLPADKALEWVQRLPIDTTILLCDQEGSAKRRARGAPDRHRPHGSKELGCRAR